MMGERIKQKRLELGLTQEQLANKLGLQKSAVAKYENGRVTNIKRTIIVEMSRIFDCSPTWLMGLEPNTPIEQQKIALKSYEDLAHFRRYHSLNSVQRKKVDDLIDELLDHCEDH